MLLVMVYTISLFNYWESNSGTIKQVKLGAELAAEFRYFGNGTLERGREI